MATLALSEVDSTFRRFVLETGRHTTILVLYARILGATPVGVVAALPAVPAVPAVPASSPGVLEHSGVLQATLVAFQPSAPTLEELEVPSAWGSPGGRQDGSETVSSFQMLDQDSDGDELVPDNPVIPYMLSPREAGIAVQEHFAHRIQVASVQSWALSPPAIQEQPAPQQMANPASSSMQAPLQGRRTFGRPS